MAEMRTGLAALARAILTPRQEG
jgi:hypothetical protein